MKGQMVCPKSYSTFYAARSPTNGKRIYLGSFNNQIDAARAYDKATKKYHGRFAALNFPD